MKNVVFIPNIDLGNGRSDSYSYSIKSWKRWCDKNNCELLIWEDLLYPVDYMKITWQRYNKSSHTINSQSFLSHQYFQLLIE
jgi:hypothetical protein